MASSMRSLGCLLSLAVACTKPNPAATCPDGTCSDPNFAFCDSTGAITGSPGQCVHVECNAGEHGLCDGDTALVCNASGDGYEPLACDAGCEEGSGCRPFCTAGMAMSCTGSELTTCNAQGTAFVTESCALGCASDEARCLTFEPFNGLGPELAASTLEPEVSLPAGSRIDTDSEVVQDSTGAPIAVPTAVVLQAGGESIFVIRGRSLDLAGVTVTGTRPIAFVASGSIDVRGRVSVRAVGSVPAAGAISSANCNGGDMTVMIGGCAPNTFTIGAGGAGNAQAGGFGGTHPSPSNGGGTRSGFSPLSGGCSGGSQHNPTNTAIVARGGGGGGAIQIVSGTRARFIENGVIDVGGGGGQSTAGGGSGGVVIIEAPEVSFIGASAGVAANGGAGGGCGTKGPDATFTTSPAVAASCSLFFGGNGGTGSLSPTSGCNQLTHPTTCASDCGAAFGGGGASVGRARIATASGVFESSGNPILSVKTTTAVLSPK